MVMNLDKCIGCHTCSITCKNVWTNREGAEYMYFNNVETKPGTGYPRDWENQEKWKGGWKLDGGELSLRTGSKLERVLKLFYHPEQPELKDYYEPWTYDYETLISSKRKNHQPVARPRSLITQKRMEIKMGPNWDDDLAGGDSARKDYNLKKIAEDITLEFQDIFMKYLPRNCNHCLNPACVAACPSGAIYKRDEDGVVLVSADYSQIELRIMAHLSKDPSLIEAFREGHDIHAATAARIYHKTISEVTKDERRKAKTANFGIIYGISAFGLAERMEVPRAEAKELIDSYFNTYPKVREFISSCIELARENKYIETAFGRRRYLPDILSSNPVVRGYAERNAVNAPIQGTAADIIKIAMVRIDQRLREENLQAKMILQVHDELNFSVPTQELDNVRKIVVHEMQEAYAMSVPLIAECGIGSNWLEAH